MDYCTWFPEGWWAHCCAAHDRAYAEQIGKALADERLWSCVAQAGPGGLIGAGVASVMFAGVALFGRRWYRRARAGTMR